jgi:phage baseplate assembly protein W
MTTPPPPFRPEPRAFLGAGLGFPLTVTPQGRIARVSGEAKVEQSIWFLLSTALGERVMRPDLGCGAHDLLFAPNSDATVIRVTDQVRRCLTAHEPRIAVLDVQAEVPASESNVLLIRVSYQLHANNAIGNLVYPFFITEGA